MKNKILGLLGFIAVVAFLVSSCVKSPVEKSRESYDWNSIVPKILYFHGPTEVAASGLAAVTYEVPSRGGSTYEWKAEGYGATIVPRDNYPNIADVTWDQSSVDTSALLIVTETTHGGQTASDTLAVTLKKFCPWNISDFVGTWKGMEQIFREKTGAIVKDSLDITLEITADPNNENGLVIKSIEDPNAEGGKYLPQILAPIYGGWGERFQEGNPDEGNVYLTMGLLDGSITVKDAHWGQTLPGPYDYWCDGGGAWSGCTSSMKFTFNMYWAEDKSDGYGSIITVTKQ